MHIASAPPSPRLNIITVINMMCKHHICFCLKSHSNTCVSQLQDVRAQDPGKGEQDEIASRLLRLVFMNRKPALLGASEPH